MWKKSFFNVNTIKIWFSNGFLHRHDYLEGYAVPYKYIRTQPRGVGFRFLFYRVGGVSNKMSCFIVLFMSLHPILPPIDMLNCFSDEHNLVVQTEASSKVCMVLNGHQLWSISRDLLDWAPAMVVQSKSQSIWQGWSTHQGGDVRTDYGKFN